MAEESIIDYKRPGYPKTQNSEKSYRTLIEYIGPHDLLSSAEPASNDQWGDYPGKVASTNLSPIEGTEHATLQVTTEYFYDNEDGQPGEADSVTLEVDWVVLQRSMYEHPAFAPGEGGQFELNGGDLVDIASWEREEDRTLKTLYQYLDGTDVVELSLNARMFARGIELAQDVWEDYVPVIRRTTNYSNGNPANSTAGEKGGEPSFAGKPRGYEWRKSADRGVNDRGQTRWSRQEEWIGAKKVLSDKKRVYWAAP